MHKDSKIYIAGHRGLVGSAILKKLQNEGYKNLILRTHQELDLTRQREVEEFFQKEKPEYVFLCAAKAGGMAYANAKRAEFLYENLMIQNNVLQHSFLNGVKKLIFLASTTIYPKISLQPIKEEYLLDSKLEYNFESYAIAKIAGLKLCEAYNIQFQTNFIGVAPASLYGNNVSFDFKNAQVLPALLRKIHLAKLLNEGRDSEVLQDLKLGNIEEAKAYLQTLGIGNNSVEIWGSGNAKRDFLHCEDLADALLFLMQNVDFKDLHKDEKEITNTHINIGYGSDISIKELAELIAKIVGFKGELIFDSSKPEGALRKLGSIEKISKLGWSAKIPLEYGVKQLYQWYQECGGGGF
ncbi:GDP-L-fucose synthase [Helicobacter sp.]|uniref:GDP-L-fucose synthase family protein n=1 Tax=Helicobacter sp. TaxID=218 RepID=UPI001982B060|nr:GDP-L-fucose synthase [Helicobacter sp.]MBD5164988.1 GDP-L-fucose synthase [Helicobacter sp.]